MRSAAAQSLLEAEDDLLTTGEAARLLGASRQHVVDLCAAGDLPFTTTGTHRRVRRADVEALRTRSQRLTRDQARSLWLGHAVAGHFVADPQGVRALGLENLARMQQSAPRGAARVWLDQWRDLLSGPVEDVLDVLTSRSPRARELRQNSPFAGVLGVDERRELLRIFNHHRPAG